MPRRGPVAPIRMAPLRSYDREPGPHPRIPHPPINTAHSECDRGPWWPLDTRSHVASPRGRARDAGRRLQALLRCGHPGHHPARPAGRRGRSGRSHQQIDNLTVLSTDGASEIVRTATTNLTQAGHAIKGLTGIDIPQVFGNALDNANLTGTSTERSIRARTEPETAAEDRTSGPAGATSRPSRRLRRSPGALAHSEPRTGS